MHGVGQLASGNSRYVGYLGRTPGSPRDLGVVGWWLGVLTSTKKSNMAQLSLPLLRTREVAFCSLGSCRTPYHVDPALLSRSPACNVAIIGTYVWIVSSPTCSAGRVRVARLLVAVEGNLLAAAGVPPRRAEPGRSEANICNY